MQEQKRPTAEIFSERLRELRGNRSQADFAQFLGIGQQRTYANYEKGRIPGGAILEQICNRLGVSADYLLGSQNEIVPQIVCDLTDAIIIAEDKPPAALTDRELNAALAAILQDFHSVPAAYQNAIWPRIEDLFQELRTRHERRVSAGIKIRRQQRYDDLPKPQGKKP